jgi:hypothetical protein
LENCDIIETSGVFGIVVLYDMEILMLTRIVLHLIGGVLTNFLFAAK